MLTRGLLPLKAVFDDVNDSTDDTPIILPLVSYETEGSMV